jgi:hypothetical protein
MRFQSHILIVFSATFPIGSGGVAGQISRMHPEDFSPIMEAIQAANRARETTATAAENLRRARETLEKARRLKSPWPHPIRPFLVADAPETAGGAELTQGAG